MTAPLILVLFIFVVSALGTRVLATATWPTRAPALGILTWQALTAAVALAVVFAGLAIALPQLHLTVDLARLAQACVEELRHQYGTPGGALLSGAGAILSVGVLGRFGLSLASAALRARSARARHSARLEMVTYMSRNPDVTVIEHEVPMVYCLPGRGRRVVVTRGATEVLTERELTGVLAHERAHLRAHHHLATLVAGALSRTFFDLRLFALARDRITELIEMHADDAAGADRRRDLASALVQLAGLGAPLGALGARGVRGPIARIIRLSTPQDPLPRSAQVPIVLAAAVIVAIPMLLAMIPVGVALVADCCGAGGLPRLETVGHDTACSGLDADAGPSGHPLLCPIVESRGAGVSSMKASRAQFRGECSVSSVKEVGHGMTSSSRRPWYRRTWRRVSITIVTAAALGTGAGLAYTSGGPGQGSGLVAGTAREDLSGTGRAVTEYLDAQRGQPVQVSGTTLTGQPFSLEDLRGDVVVLNVWGSWCAPCRAEAPILAEADREFASAGVAFAGINVRDNPAAARAFEKRYAIPYPSVADPDGRTLLGLNEYVPMSAVPVTLVLDRQGRVAARVLGELREATLSALLNDVLAERDKS